MSRHDLRLAEVSARAGITRQRRPIRPALVVAGRCKPFEFERLDQLARKVQDLRGDGGLRLQKTFVSWPGFQTFEAVNLYSIDDVGQERFLACAAIQGRPIETLESAIRAAEVL